MSKIEKLILKHEILFQELNNLSTEILSERLSKNISSIEGLRNNVENDHLFTLSENGIYAAKIGVEQIELFKLEKIKLIKSFIKMIDISNKIMTHILNTRLNSK